MSVLSLDIEKILPNDKDNRSLEGRQIAIIAESIKLKGMLEPLVVYPNENDTYTLVAGRRRYEACKQLGINSVTCTIVEKPNDMIAEMELLAQANIHRSTPEDLKYECQTMNRTWETMDDETKNRIKGMLKEAFLEVYQDNPRYLEDPEGFTQRNFRPRLDYIRLNTGLDVSNGTVKNYLKQVDDSRNEETATEITEESSSSSSSSSVPTPKKVSKQIKKLRNMLDEMQPESPEQYEMMVQLSQALDTALPFFAPQD